MTNRKQHNWRRAALALPVLAVSLALTGAASAQTITFQATVTSSPVDVSGVAKTQPSCAATVPPDMVAQVVHLLCGSASIAGYGPADWTLNTLVPGPTATSSACFDYHAITTFHLHDREGSTLVLDEGDPKTGDIAQACAPGNSGSAARQDYFVAPLFSPEPAQWRVDTTGVYGANTGAFDGMTGCGTDTLQSTGPRTTGTYTTPTPWVTCS